MNERFSPPVKQPEKIPREIWNVFNFLHMFYIIQQGFF